MTSILQILQITTLTGDAVGVVFDFGADNSILAVSEDLLIHGFNGFLVSQA